MAKFVLTAKDTNAQTDDGLPIKLYYTGYVGGMFVKDISRAYIFRQEYAANFARTRAGYLLHNTRGDRGVLLEVEPLA